MSDLSKGLKAFEPGMSLSEIDKQQKVDKVDDQFGDLPKIERQSVKPVAGVKYSDHKLQYSLIPPYALQEVARNLTEGLRKYPERNNWSRVPNARQKYLDALMRHLESYRRGNKYDTESSAENMHELAAVIANAMFILEFDLNPNLVEVKE